MLFVIRLGAKIQRGNYTSFSPFFFSFHTIMISDHIADLYRYMSKIARVSILKYVLTVVMN